jgi:hypothetical protein
MMNVLVVLVQKSWRIAAVLAIAMFVFVTTGAFAHGNENPGVFPINASIYGLTYNQWSARWWQWASSLPNLNDCRVNQSGKVWFLAGIQKGQPVPPPSPCPIPAGKAIMFPIINVEWSRLEAEGLFKETGKWCPVSAPINGTSDAALASCARAQINHTANFQASVDGQDLVDLCKYRVLSPPFNVNAVAGNPYGVPSGPNRAVSDGYWIILKPLSPGMHTLHFASKAFFPTLPPDQSTFEIDTTYQLNIVGHSPLCNMTDLSFRQCG